MYIYLKVTKTNIISCSYNVRTHTIDITPDRTLIGIYKASDNQLISNKTKEYKRIIPAVLDILNESVGTIIIVAIKKNIPLNFEGLLS